MKSYKILENRPELSKEQLKEGMDFSTIKMNVGIAKTVLLKSIIIKSVLVIAIVSSSVLIYKNVSTPTSEKKAIVINDSIKHTTKLIADSSPITKNIGAEIIIIPKNDEKKIIVSNNSIAIATIDSPKVIITVKKEPCTQAEQSITTCSTNVVQLTKSEETVTAPITNMKPLKGVNVKGCKIWGSKNFCALPKEAVFPTSFECDACEFDYIDCQTANSKGNSVCVWLTVTTNGKSIFEIESYLKNIVLTGSGKPQFPLMIGVSNDHKFLSSNLKVKKYTGHFNKQIDIFLFFSTAKKGDKISIRNFVEAIIEP